jgi:hypothetical protein
MSGLFADPREDRETTKAYMMSEGVSPSDADALLDHIGTFAVEDVSCSVQTISDVIDEAHVKRIELLKIDVEKSELEVLRGIRPDHWKRIQRIVVEVHDLDARVRQINSMLGQAGYRTFVEQHPKLKNTDLFYIFACCPDAA